MVNPVLYVIVISLSLSPHYASAETGKYPDQSTIAIRPNNITDNISSATTLKKIKQINKKVPIVEIYGTSGCPYCKKARKYFDNKNIPYKYYDINKNNNTKLHST